MKGIGQVEKERMKFQKKLDSKKTQKERNILGQFATPSPLALEMIEYIEKEGFLINQKISFLDPALGTGSFFSALISTFSDKEFENVSGIEIDSEFSNVAEQLWSSFNLNVINNAQFREQS